MISEFELVSLREYYLPLTNSSPEIYILCCTDSVTNVLELSCTSTRYTPHTKEKYLVNWK